MIKAGQLISITSGSFSDFSLHGIFKAAKDFNPDDALRQYLAANPEQKRGHQFDESDFLASLVTDGYISEVDHAEIYLTDYSNASEFRWSP